jgi:hypothetical protein
MTDIVERPDFPCHSKPREEWCDWNGPGDFMGHTCVRRDSSLWFWDFDLIRTKDDR